MPSKTKQKLPPDVVIGDDGQLYREVQVAVGDGTTRTRRRPVADNLPEAKAKRWDYYHPQYGWIVEGYKLAVDRPVRDIMADATIGGPPPSDDNDEE